MEVDGIVVVIAEEGHVVEIVDEGKVPGVGSVDFLKVGISITTCEAETWEGVRDPVDRQGFG